MCIGPYCIFDQEIILAFFGIFGECRSECKIEEIWKNDIHNNERVDVEESCNSCSKLTAELLIMLMK